MWHVVAVAGALSGHGNHFALTWAVAFALMWWTLLSWAEAPVTTTPRQQRRLDTLTVTVQVPVYNEDPTLLWSCLESILYQTRRPSRIAVVDDGSEVDYSAERERLYLFADRLGIEASWVRTENRGKRWAQMEALADDPADIFVTLDSDSVLERSAIGEGLKPFSDPKVQSVAGMVLVWNYRRNFLTRLTCTLYTPFTRGFRSAQSVLGRVMVNSGTLAFYRGAVVRRYADSYPRETFAGRGMQMNDDSMLTLYGVLHGRTVHQPSSAAFTMVPEQASHYLRQQLRWMRGTFIRNWWWYRYLPLRDPGFWMPLLELVGIVLSPAIIVALVAYYPELTTAQGRELLVTTAGVSVLVNYTVALRYFMVKRSDESTWQQVLTVALAPLAGVWRLVLLRPLMFYAMATCWKTGWGTRQAGVEVAINPQH